jgi:alpha-beta hydrolase superfamily lysophospholipase
MTSTHELRYDFQFTSKDGLQIACSRWQSGVPTQGVIHIAHGMGEHNGRYSELSGSAGSRWPAPSNFRVQLGSSL